eukprot:TRINITY_DN1123_c0_g1_i1.p1 TRINITY_DN1123_c0_g1~~TRINITY_DN1123_c0_g1_i1.p1  ORF type:complete len:143 (-),score=29.12 TRINITY_DN1123_c0_g1_i1:129-557(-)
MSEKTNESGLHVEADLSAEEARMARWMKKKQEEHQKWKKSGDAAKPLDDWVVELKGLPQDEDHLVEVLVGSKPLFRALAKDTQVSERLEYKAPLGQQSITLTIKIPIMNGFEQTKEYKATEGTALIFEFTDKGLLMKQQSKA